MRNVMHLTLRDYEYINRVLKLEPVTWSSVIITSPDYQGLQRLQRRLDMLHRNEDKLVAYLGQNEISAARVDLAGLMLTQHRRYIGTMEDSIDEIKRFIARKEQE